MRHKDARAAKQPAKNDAARCAEALYALEQRVIVCRKCPRLVAYREAVAREKRLAFKDCEYWGRPVPGFGDPAARLLVVGLAPAAHGGNRTGRVFTGDRSGDFLYAALYRAGFANQPISRDRKDGLRLTDACVTAVVRCAPPGNKPLPSEMANCRPYFERELELLPNLRAILALGKIAFDTYLQILKERGLITTRAAYPFEHGAFYEFSGGVPALFASYHPSQQNTFTGKLTSAMLDGVLARIRAFLNR